MWEVEEEMEEEEEAVAVVVVVGGRRRIVFYCSTPATLFMLLSLSLFFPLSMAQKWNKRNVVDTDY